MIPLQTSTPRRRFSPHLAFHQSRTARFSSASTGSSTTQGSNKYNYAWVESAIIRPAHVLQGLVHAVWPNSVKEIPTACVDYFRDITAAGGAEAVKIVDHTHCTKWDNANAESQCITNILSDDEMAAFRMSPAAKPSFIVAIVVALVVAFIGA